MLYQSYGSIDDLMSEVKYTWGQTRKICLDKCMLFYVIYRMISIRSVKSNLEVTPMQYFPMFMYCHCHPHNTILIHYFLSVSYVHKWIIILQLCSDFWTKWFQKVPFQTLSKKNTSWSRRMLFSSNELQNHKYFDNHNMHLLKLIFHLESIYISIMLAETRALIFSIVSWN